MSAGSDPNDYYNGDMPTITFPEGNHQFGFTDTTYETGLKLFVADSEGTPLINAPVTLQVRKNGTLVRGAEASSPRYNALTLRTDAQGFIGDAPDSFVYYTSGSQSGVETVDVVAGDSSERTFTFTVIESGTTSQPIDFRKRYHSDGSTTLSWRGAMMDTDELVIRMLGPDGSWQVIDQLTHLETDWPTLNLQISRYEITLESTDKTDVFQIGKKIPDGDSYVYSHNAGLPTPNYAIIPVDSDGDIRAIANNGWDIAERRGPLEVRSCRTVGTPCGR